MNRSRSICWVLLLLSFFGLSQASAQTLEIKVTRLARFKPGHIQLKPTPPDLWNGYTRAQKDSLIAAYEAQGEDMDWVRRLLERDSLNTVRKRIQAQIFSRDEQGRAKVRSTQDSLWNIFRGMKDEFTHLAALDQQDKYREMLALLDPDTVTQLDLSGAHYTEIPDIVWQCTHLEYLDLSYNRLTRIPADIKRLKHLKVLELHHNHFTGKGMRFKKSYTLQSLDLANNQLSQIPRSLRKLKALTELELSHNRIASIERLGKLPALTDLLLNFNPTLQLDRRSFRGLQTLNVLSMRACSLQTLPPEIGRLSGLTDFTAPENQLKHIPAEIGQLRNLQTLMLYKNELTELPPALFTLQKLIWLDLYYNKLEVIPETLGKLNALEILYLAHNGLEALPQSIGQLTRLREFYAYDNNLAGLPASMTKLQKLKVLHLYQNQFYDFPAPILALKGLTELDISKNIISAFPAGLAAALPNLTLFWAQENEVFERSMEEDELKTLADTLKQRGVNVQF